MPLLETGGTNYFKIDGQSKLRGQYELVRPSAGDSFGIVHIGTNDTVYLKGAELAHYTDWDSATDTPFASATALQAAFDSFFF